MDKNFFKNLFTSSTKKENPIPVSKPEQHIDQETMLQLEEACFQLDKSITIYLDTIKKVSETIDEYKKIGKSASNEDQVLAASNLKNTERVRDLITKLFDVISLPEAQEIITTQENKAVLVEELHKKFDEAEEYYKNVSNYFLPQN